MFGKKIPLFKLFGFSVNVDVSWLILAILVTWSLAERYFRPRFEGLSSAAYWCMAAAGGLGLFASIIFHEFSHSLIARRYGLPMKGITLFIFGGVAEMSGEPEGPKTEFLMAVAGPASSLSLAAVLHIIRALGQRAGFPVAVDGVLQWLVLLNLMLAGFNLLPAFPLDGGRVLRSILWATKGDVRWATKIASKLGSGFGLFLIIMGVFLLIVGDFVNGVWCALIGVFIRAASQMSYKQLLLRNVLGGEEIQRFMKPNPITVSPSVSIEQLVNDYFYKYHFKMFPVCDGEKLLGCITSNEVKDLPNDEWGQRTVADLAKPCSDQNTIRPDADAMKALSTMSRSGNSRLMVVADGQLVGIITLKDMLKFLGLKIDLEVEKT